ncbi:hypothetical protein ES677_07920 [Bizionia gelidisalsuginis]|uniref:Prenyltransferase n=2 Tax=Bizionia TaxID=283785 RepID=A0A8H2LC80_9FLAO|nr:MULTISPECIES: hypothetical protein [Bizionia]TYB73904.1 hypothetical protein ES676_09170 [Bizionia saleffrena]TYC12867.1 hypothetical protein ES677_07920 [Bizionia gelidisalsuginis]
MNLIKQLFNFYLNSSVHVALSVVSLSFITVKEFGVTTDYNVLSFIFFATITGYNFVKFFGIAKWHYRSLAKWLKIIQIFSLLCFLCMGYFMLQLEMRVLLYLSVFAAITFLYAMPIIPKRLYVDSNHNLRDISGLKVYIIGLVWAGVTVILPLINSNITSNADVILTTIQRFVFLIAIMLPFEIRDLTFDNFKLATIPQKIGVKQTKIMGLFLLMLFLFLEFFKNELVAVNFATLMVVTLVTAGFILFANKNNSMYYSAFWVESIPILWLLIMVFG